MNFLYKYYNFASSGGGGGVGGGSRRYTALDETAIAINTFGALPTVVNALTDYAVMRELGTLPKGANPIKWVKDTPKIADYAMVFGDDMTKFAGVSRSISTSLNRASFAISAYAAAKYFRNGRYGSSIARVVVSLATVGVSAVPVIGPFLSITIGVIDSVYLYYAHNNRGNRIIFESSKNGSRLSFIMFIIELYTYCILMQILIRRLSQYLIM